MGWLAVAAPYIVQGVGALGSWLGSRKAGKRNEEESTALSGAQGAATGMEAAGSSLLQKVQQPANYWGSLLGGDRAKMAQATAPARSSILDTYRGAERGLERSGVRGAQRDVAISELIRDRAAKVAGLTQGVQPQAAQALTDIAGMGTPLLANSASIWGNLLGQATQNRQNADQVKREGGASAGRYLFDLASSLATAYGNRSGSGGGISDTRTGIYS